MIRQLFFKFFPLLFGIYLCFFSAATHATPTTFSTEVFIAISSGTSSYPLSGIYDIQFELLDSDDELVFSKSVQPAFKWLKRALKAIKTR